MLRPQPAPRTVALCALLALGGCSFDAGVPPGLAIACDERGLCPSGYVCRPRFKLCVSEANPDREAPRVVSSAVAPAVLGRGGTVRLELTLSEPLADPPQAVFLQAERSVPLRLVDSVAAPQPTARFELTVDEQAREGTATLAVSAVDVAGNESLGVAVGAVTLDFTGPTLSAASFSAPRTADGGLLTVRRGEALGVRLIASEPLSVPGALIARGACDGGPTFRPGGGTAGLVDFASSGDVGAHGCTFELDWLGARDVAGNAAGATAQPTGLRYTVDAIAPTVDGLALVRPLADGGVERVALASRAPGFDRFEARFSLSEPPSTLEVRLDEQALAGCGLADCTARGAQWDCRCPYTVSAADTEGAHVVAVATADLAGNVRTFSVPIAFDFTPPRVLPGATQLALTPPPGCSQQTVAALGAGGTARLLFSTSEPSASVALSTVPEALPFTLESAESTSFAFLVQLDGGAPREVSLEARVTAVDAVGNAATSVLFAADAGRLRVDTAPPPALVAAATGLLYRRAPWGDESGVPRFDVVADAGVLPPQTRLRVLDGPQPATASELGRAVADETGAVVVPLLRADRASVFVSSVDDACNASPPAEVKEIEWLATPGRKLRGSALENPHRYAVARTFVPSPSQPFGVEVDGALVGQRDAGAQASRAEATWVLRTQGYATPWVNDHVAAYDSARSRLVVFGGYEGAATRTVRELVGDVWLIREPIDLEGDGNPEARTESAMVYDTQRRRSVLFGGNTVFQFATGDTWEWDGYSWARRALTGGPPARTEHSMAYDERRGVTVLFGGYAGGVALDDTWEWDGHAWRQVALTGVRPTARAGAAMGYDATRQRVVLYGGDTMAGQRFADTWTFDGTAWTRAQLTGPPGARAFGFVVGFDGQALLLHGGERETLPPATDTWSWNGTTWISVATSTAEPRYAPAGAFDTARQRLVMAGGWGDVRRDVTDETWVLQRGASPGPWTLLNTDVPLPQRHVAAAYDPRRQTTVFFGGGETPDGPHNDVFEWNGARWRLVGADGGSPAARLYGSAVFEPSRGAVMLLDGRDPGDGHLLADQWAFDGGTWRRLANGPTFGANGVAADATRRRLVVFGESYSQYELPDPHTWEYVDGGWVRRAISGPPERFGGVTVWDAARGRTLLFSGTGTRGILDDLWSWNGTAWARLVTPVAPPPRSDAHGCYDAVRDRFVVFGGLGGSGSLGDTWEFDGTAWQRDESPIAPPPRANGAFACDATRGMALLFGGLIAEVQPWFDTSYRGDLWEYGVQPGATAGQAFTVSLNAAAVGAGATAQSLGVRWVVGADGVGGAGARLWVGDRGSLTGEASHLAGTATPTELTWTTTDPARLARLFSSVPFELPVAVSALGPSQGTTASTVAVDYVEVRLRYRRN